MAINTAYTSANADPASTPVRQRASGKITFPATAIVPADYISIDCGFQPAYVQFVNFTDRITVEAYAGMADDTCLKTVAAGTRTAEDGTNKGITIGERGFTVSQNVTLAAIAASKVCYWVAVA